MSPVNGAVTEVVFVTGFGEAVTEVPTEQSLVVPQKNEGTVEVEPTVNVPFIVAVVEVTALAGSVVTPIAENCVRVDPTNVPPRAFFKAASSFAACSCNSVMTSCSISLGVFDGYKAW